MLTGPDKSEEWREYLLWTTAIDLAHEIGAKNAWGIDVHNRCATTIAAMKLAKGLMAEGGEGAERSAQEISDEEREMLEALGYVE